MEELEEMLNRLVSEGWKPRGLTIMGKIKIDYDIEFAFDIYDSLQKGHWNFRELVSKESGLWQFVCKNGMIKNPNIERYWKNYFELDHIEYYQSDFQYWLLESSLKDESGLEDFLLQNIKVGND